MRSAAQQHTRPIWAEISASALRANYRAVAAGASGMPVLAIVKADAYGHGVVECAPVLAAAGAPWLGVTSVEEGVLVRRALSILPQTMAPRVLVMCGVWPGEAQACLDYQLTPVVWEPYHLDLLEAVAAHAGMLPQSLAVHVEIDTGMSRQGIPPGDLLRRCIERVAASRLWVEGVMTHMASAETADDPQNEQQREIFTTALEQSAAAGLRPAWVHVGNSSGVESGMAAAWLPELAALVGAHPMTRAGMALYGYTLPLTGAMPSVHDLRPVLAWKTRIVSLRDIPPGTAVGYGGTYIATAAMRLALLPVGYADGFRRSLSSATRRLGGRVIVRGVPAPIVGRVSMDLTIVDVTGIAAEIGDEVTLIGSEGVSTVTADDHAALAGTSVYEVLCGISDRVPRHLVD